MKNVLKNEKKLKYYCKLLYSGQTQTFIVSLATVMQPRHQTATLVYSNPQQLGTNVTGPRLAVASPIATQRQVRPIQISSARLPTAGLSRVSTATGCKLFAQHFPFHRNKKFFVEINSMKKI